ncbi:MAG: hypothetical protein RR619_08700, partial [Raoultibacter sp.]
YVYVRIPDNIGMTRIPLINKLDEIIKQLDREDREYDNLRHDASVPLQELTGETSPQSISALKAEIERRTMPKGMEWPRFEDGEFVVSGDRVLGDADDEHTVWTIRLCCNGGWHYRLNDPSDRVIHDLWAPCSERVKRPAPQVLAADGLPIKVGERLWSTQSRLWWVVTEINKHNVPRGYDEKTGSKSRKYELVSEWLTHTPPDTQECINDDAFLGADLYVEKYPHVKELKHYDELGYVSQSPSIWQLQRLDLIRRQRELDVLIAGGARC